MGFGRMAIATFMVLVLAFVLVSAFSNAFQHQPTNIYTDNTTAENKTQAVATTVASSGALLFVPIVAVCGILLLASAFFILKKR